MTVDFGVEVETKPTAQGYELILNAQLAGHLKCYSGNLNVVEAYNDDITQDNIDKILSDGDPNIRYLADQNNLVVYK